jgi:hypothetical protein
VFAGLYPVEASEYDSLRDALEKLKLNDASLHYEPEVSQALGFGFRCGFLGLLHMEIVQERLEREFDQDLITTAPSVVYQVLQGDGEVIMVENPAKMPDQGRLQEIREPIVTVHLYMPQEYVGAVMTLANQKRGVQMNMAYHGRQVMLTYELPLGEIVLDFFDKLKSVSRGYASMDYEFKEYRASDVVKVDILLNGEKVDALSIIVHRTPVAVPGPRGGGQDARDHQPPDVRRGDPGGHRRQHHRPRDHQGAAQERAGKMLRRRHQPQAQAPRKTEGRQETHEADRLGRSAPGSVPRHPPGRGMKHADLTAAVLAAFVGYAGAWYFGMVEGNFALLLFLATLVTGLYWVAERLYFLPRRRRAADALEAHAEQRHGQLAAQGITRSTTDIAEAKPAPADAALVAGLDRRPVPGDPGGVRAALVPVRAVQDPVRLDDPHAAGGRPDPGEQVHLRPPPAGHQHQAHRRHAAQARAT